jgi:hypothetical protein
MTTTTADRMMAQVAQMTDAEVLNVLALAKSTGADRYVNIGLTVEAFQRGLIGPPRTPPNPSPDPIP